MTTNKRNDLNRRFKILRSWLGSTAGAPQRRRRGLLLGGCLFVPVLAALLLGAGGDKGSRVAQHRREIEQMTPAQRARLDRNFRAFGEMSSELRRHYRGLHRQLQTSEDADALRVTLDRYRNWLKTLSPFQREELRAIGNIDERVDRVRQLKNEQATPAPLSDGAPRLSRQDFAAMMNAIAEELSIVSAELDGKSEWHRFLFILNSLAESKRNQHRLGNQPRSRDWSWMFDDRLMAKMIAALPAGEFRDAIADVHRFKDVERRIVVGNMIEILGRELAQALESIKPSETETKRLLLRMKPEERHRYHELASQDDKDQFILRRYRMRRMYEMLKPYPALRPLFMQMAAFREGKGPRRNAFSPRAERDLERRRPDGKRPRLPRPPPDFRRGDKNRPGNERRENR